MFVICQIKILSIKKCAREAADVNGVATFLLHIIFFLNDNNLQKCMNKLDLATVHVGFWIWDMF